MEAPHRDGISLVIPAYNEEDRLSKSLEAYLPVLKSFHRPYEIIVVIDGMDNTYGVAQGYASQGVRPFRYDMKLGKGGAIREGILLARHVTIAWVDADGSLSAHDLQTMLEVSSGFDCVVASRWVAGSVWLEKEPLFNRAVGRVFNFMVRGTLGLPIADTQCGAKVFKASIARHVISSTVVTNRTFDVAVLYHARKSGASMVEVPVSWRHDADTRMPIFRVIPIMFITLIGIRLMNLPIRKYLPTRFVDYFVRRYARD